MFKDYDKYLRQSLKVYLFLLVVIFIFKLVGLDYFGLDINNVIVTKISMTISKNHIGDIYNFICIYLQFYFYLCLVCEKKRLYKEALIGALLNFIPQCLLFTFYKLNWIYYLICSIITIVMPMIINKKIFIKKQIKYIILITIYQYISLITRNINIHYEYGNFIVDSLLNIDQLLMLAITYNIYFMKGGNKLCGVEQEVGSFLQMKKNFSNLQRNLQEKCSNFKKLEKQDKATFIIYFLFSLIWNIFTVAVVLIIANLNNTLIECLFILTSFWISKRVFGKAFHLKSMLQCFVLSNATYYVLNKLTTPMSISILVPIMLGVGLSYVTSKLVKKTLKPLYKGMPKDDFEETILKVVDKNSDKYKICYDYFIEKENAIFLARRYNYTEAGIRKITSRVNDDIKALNK